MDGHLNKTLEGVIYHLVFTLGASIRANELSAMTGVPAPEINRFLSRKIYGPINEMIRARTVG